MGQQTESCNVFFISHIFITGLFTDINNAIKNCGWGWQKVSKVAVLSLQNVIPPSWRTAGIYFVVYPIFVALKLWIWQGFLKIHVDLRYSLYHAVSSNVLDWFFCLTTNVYSPKTGMINWLVEESVMTRASNIIVTLLKHQLLWVKIREGGVIMWPL